MHPAYSPQSTASPRWQCRTSSTPGLSPAAIAGAGSRGGRLAGIRNVAAGRPSRGGGRRTGVMKVPATPT